MTKILLVEDNAMNRTALSQHLVHKGFDVEIAADGQEGLIMAGKIHPDVILMDMTLPIMDGWETTRKLKADVATQRIPVIALTAHAMSSDRIKAMDAGCNDYDTKPIDLERLLRKIETALKVAEAAK